MLPEVFQCLQFSSVMADASNITLVRGGAE